ncbi:MAG: electron transfer flavoprotein subunit alpha/FixB family protein, partial [Desulfomonilia bacterium]
NLERQDFKTAKNVLVLAEINEDRSIPNIVLQLLGLGKGLATHFGERLYAIIIGKDISSASEELSRYGVDEVFAADDERYSEYNPDIYLPVLERVCKDINLRLLLSGHTSAGQDLLPRLAFALNAGLITDCIDIKAAGGELSFTRPVYGGNVLAKQRVRSTIAIATVRVGVGKPPALSTGAGKITSLAPAFPVETRLKITGRTLVDQKDCPLEEASVVVSGGKGMGGKEGFKLLLELARFLGGAVGATRPPCDLGWAPPSCQVGITGKVVAPDLYIAVGISGSTQHLSGMGDSRKIVAINKDPEANIFNVSDYGLVGDWKQILPPFMARLKDLMGNRG